MVDLSDYSAYFPSIVATVLFLLIVPFGKTSWIRADTTITVIWGIICVFFPKQFLNYQVDGILDDVSIHFYRLFGLILLSTSLFAIFTWTSKDPAVQVTVLWARTLSISIYILNRIYSYYVLDYRNTKCRWNKQSLIFGVYGDCLWLLGNLINAIRITDWGGVKETFTKPDFHLRLDFLQTLLFAILFYIFPGQMVGFQVKEHLSGMNTSLIRVFASFVLGSSVIACRASNFESLDDKVKHLMSRLLINAGILTAQMYTHYTTASWSVWHIYFGMVGMSIWSINSAMGYFSAIKILEEKKQD